MQGPVIAEKISKTVYIAVKNKNWVDMYALL